MTDLRSLAVTYLRWFIQQSRAASPAEVSSGILHGHTFQVQLPGRPGANRTLQVDGLGPWFRIVELWDEAKTTPKQPVTAPSLPSQMELFA